MKKKPIPFIFMLIALIILTTSQMSTGQGGGWLEFIPFVTVPKPDCGSSVRGASLGNIREGVNTEAHLIDKYCMMYVSSFDPEDRSDLWPNMTLIPYFWCDSRNGRNMREWFSEQWTAQEMNNRLALFINEWGHTGQCNAPASQVVSDFNWLVTNYPGIRLIVGNMQGLDGLNNWSDSAALFDAFSNAGIDLCQHPNVAAFSYHNYTGTPPPQLHQSWRSFLSSRGCPSGVKTAVTEWGVNDPALAEAYVTYLDAQPDIILHQFFNPCQGPISPAGRTHFGLFATEHEFTGASSGWSKVINCYADHPTDLGAGYTEAGPPPGVPPTPTPGPYP